MQAFDNKRVAIWGVGVLQVDIEAIYHFDDVIAYIDDEIEERNLITVERKQIITSNDIPECNDENVIFVLCTKDKDFAIRRLIEKGYSRKSYVLGEELLTNKEIYNLFRASDVTIYGAGNTYLYWKNIIESFDINIERFAVTNKSIDEFDGKPVISIDELKKHKGKTQIIVSSIYFKEIYNTLKDAGFIPGYDFIHLDTFLSIFNLTENKNGDYEFINRTKGYNKLLVILSGYKSFVWDSVFGRVERYLSDDTDVCVVTSGKEDETMKRLCEKNQWSYLSTNMNNVSLVTNMAISLHPQAEYIIKMDEDIFVTKGTFETLIETYNKVEKDSDYEVGFVSPIIPVNGYGYTRILDVLNIREKWEEKFGEIKITDCYKHHMTIHDNPEAAEFLWGKDNPAMSSIDNIQQKLQNSEFSYSICPVRYSIGLIVFDRNNWLRMGMFPVNGYENMGADEKRICDFCMMDGRAMVISENCIVGHLSYGPQHEVMRRYYVNNRDCFDV